MDNGTSDESQQNSPLISEAYRAKQHELHEHGYKGADYGGAALVYAPLIAEIVNKLEVSHLLDYGCGSKLKLAEALKHAFIKHRFKYQAYDPCVPKYSSAPVPAEMVAGIDVLEHIEEDRIDAVLDHLESLTEALAVFTINNGPAVKMLPDGRNAHVLQRPAEWWLPRIMARFDLQTFQAMGSGSFYVIVYARSRVIEEHGRAENIVTITERIDSVTKIAESHRKAICPAPKSVKIEISPRCPLRCDFCSLKTRETQPREDMDFRLFQRITREMREAGVEEAGVFYIGEAFSAPGVLVDCIKWCKDLGFPYVFLTPSPTCTIGWTPPRTSSNTAW